MQLPFLLKYYIENLKPYAYTTILCYNKKFLFKLTLKKCGRKRPIEYFAISVAN